MNDLKKMITDRLRGFGAEIVANDHAALIQFRRTPDTLAKAVMAVFPEIQSNFSSRCLNSNNSRLIRFDPLFAWNGERKGDPASICLLLTELETQKLDARNLVEFVVSMQRRGIPYAWQPFAYLPGCPANVLTRSAERILRASSGVSVL